MIGNRSGVRLGTCFFSLFCFHLIRREMNAVLSLPTVQYSTVQSSIVQYISGEHRILSCLVSLLLCLIETYCKVKCTSHPIALDR